MVHGSDLKASGEPRAASFEAHYRRLVRESALHAAATQSDLHRALGHRWRARRAARLARELSGLPLPEAVASGSPALSELRGLRLVVAAGWAVALLVLAAGSLLVGVRSWWTGSGDIALIALTFAWFVLDARGWAHPVQRGRARSATAGRGGRRTSARPRPTV